MSKTGKLNFTVDFPGLYMELTEPGNLVNLGPGGAMGLRLVLLGLKKIAQVALVDPKRHGEILQALDDLGIVSESGKC